MSGKKSGQELEEIIRNCSSAMSAGEDDLEILLESADAWRQLGQYKLALEDYQAAVESDPEDPYGYAGQAWIYATCPDPQFRNKSKAVKSALKAYRLSDDMALAIDRETGAIGSDSSIFATLAAAYAEAGKFDKARKIIAEGLAFAREEKVQNELRSYDDLYSRRQPYRDPPVSPKLAEIGKRLAEQWA